MNQGLPRLRGLKHSSMSSPLSAAEVWVFRAEQGLLCTFSRARSEYSGCSKAGPTRLRRLDTLQASVSCCAVHSLVPPAWAIPSIAQQSSQTASLPSVD